MRIIVCHITRMYEGRVCVAGIEPRTKAHVRPQTRPGEPLGYQSLSENGGAFALGVEVELGRVSRIPEPPHCEDCVFEPRQVRVIRAVPPEEFWKLISDSACKSFSDIFGDDIYHYWGQSWVTRAGAGKASLGFLRPERLEPLVLSERGVRLRFAGGGWCEAAVNDLRFHAASQAVVKRLVNAANRRIDAGEEVILGLGLTRLWRKRHWLQVNGIFFRTSPLKLFE
ncbi:MAG: hypothetical protein ABIK86_07775 [candidate division WOR-3 bacterium]